jgi:hypothetical protein
VAAFPVLNRRTIDMGAKDAADDRRLARSSHE